MVSNCIVDSLREGVAHFGSMAIEQRTGDETGPEKKKGLNRSNPSNVRCAIVAQLMGDIVILINPRPRKYFSSMRK